MSDALPEPPEIDPSTLSSASFTRSRKGFEPAEVRSLLGRAADALRVWASRDEVLARQLGELSGRLESAEHLDEAKVVELLGSETARIVTAARTAAAEIRAHAEEESARLLADSEATARSTADRLVAEATADRERAATAREEAEQQAAAIVSGATEEADRLTTEAASAAASLTADAAEQAAGVRAAAQEAAEALRREAQAHHDETIAAADSVLGERTAAAEEAAAGIRAEAGAELAEARAEAAQLRKEALDAAGGELERAREEGREMVAQAKAVRQRMLRDFAERRRTARQQIEAARVAREGIVEAIRTATVRLDDTLGELDDSEAVVSRASDEAADAVLDDVDRVVAEIEAELERGVAADEVGGPDAAAPAAPTSVVGDVGVADVDLLVSTSAVVPDAPSVQESTPAGPEPATGGDGPEVGAASGGDGAEAVTPPGSGEASADAAGGQGQMASVHDLFERLRSGEPEGAEPGGPADAVVTATLTSAAIDLTGTETVPTETETVPTETVPTETGTETVPAGTVPATSVPATGADGDPRLLDRRDELLAPAERLLARNLKRLVGDEQNDVLDRARRLKRGRVELADLLPEAGQAERFADALGEPYLLAAVAGAQMWCELTGAPAPDLTADSVGDTLASRVGMLLELRRLHLRGVLEGIDESGEDLAVLVDHLRSAYRELRATSVPELAADLATSGFNSGTRAAAGPAATWRWVPDNGGLPCSDAEDNALAGALRCGAEFPTGDVLPPAHPGCRCILAPG